MKIYFRANSLYLLVLITILVIISNCDALTGGKKKSDNTPVIAALALSSRASSSGSNGTGSTSGTVPYESEAATAGYSVPNVPVKGASALTLADSGTSLQVRDVIGSATKVDSNLVGTSTRYTPTNTTSTTNGTCIWTLTTSGSSISTCSYNYPEGACALLGQSTSAGTTNFVDFSNDTTSSTCTSKGCTSNCQTTSGFTNCYCSSAVTTGTGGSATTSGGATSYLYNTTTGVISYGFSVNPTELGTSSFTVQISVNGQSSDINFNTTGTRVTNRLVLNNGRNYVWLTISSGGAIIARSNVYRIDSTVAVSALRTELTWSGSGDVDLHADDGSGGKHVYWSAKTYTGTGESVALDVDNTTAYGPENIRVFSAPVGTNYRFYANYYSGSTSLTATAKIYSGATLLETKTLSFTSTDANASSSYNAKSKLIGTYSVSGTATGTIATGATSQSYVTLNLDHSSAVAGSKFIVFLIDAAGVKSAGLPSTTALTGTSYSGVLKAFDSNGTLTTTDATLANGSYTLMVYADSDNNNATNLLDKSYIGSVTVSGNTTLNVTNAQMVSTTDVDIQYTGGAMTAYNGKNVFCYAYTLGTAATVTSLSTLSTANSKRFLSAARGSINSGSFSGANKATIANTGVSTWINYPYSVSGGAFDIVCFIDNNANFNPDAGEPYFKVSNGVAGATILVTYAGTL